MTQGPAPRDLAERIWEKVDRSGDCWIWQASKNPAGHGMTVVGSRTDGTRRFVSAHRLVYEMTHGAIPAGHHVHHVCGNRSCVRPEHLEAVTPRDHVYLHDGPTAINGRKTNCPKCGRPLAGENLIFETGRRCKACRYEYMNALKRRLRAERRRLTK